MKFIFDFLVISRQPRKSLFIQFSVCIFLQVISFVTIFILFFSSVNVNTSAAEERVLLTGLHEVADIYCDCCKTLLGWKYVNIVTFLIIFINNVSMTAFLFLSRSMRLNQVKNIKKENILSSLYI